MQNPAIDLPDIVEAYSGASLLQRIMVRYRPNICPPGPFYVHIPNGSSVLDVGCGMGAHLITLSAMRKISSGYGVDVSSKAIERAKIAAENYPQSNLSFDTMRSVEEIPKILFDVVMMIDVMHHVPLKLRKGIFVACIDRVRAGGIFIYKDMADRPLFNALANRAHDLIIAREMINYLPLETALEWSQSEKLELIDRAEYKKLVYAHELLVFRKPQLSNA